MSVFSAIEEALEDFKAGKFLIVLDDEDRENEGDLIIAAEKVTEEAIAFIIRYTGGVICAPTTEARLNELEYILIENIFKCSLPPMVQNNTDPKKTAFTVSVDCSIGTTTGISAHDRAITIRSIADPSVGPTAFHRPGHVFPLCYHPGGVLKRCGHTEAAVDLARLSGLYPAGCLSEIMLDNGKMARLPELTEFSKQHGIKMISIADLIRYRYSRETLIYQPKQNNEETIITNYPVNTPYGQFTCYTFQSVIDGTNHIALVYGDCSKDNTMVRVQHECPLGDLVESKECNCSIHKKKALEMIVKNGSGVFISLRGVNDYSTPCCNGNSNNSEFHKVIENGLGCQILAALHVKKMIVLSSSSENRYTGVDGYGLTIVKIEPL